MAWVAVAVAGATLVGGAMSADAQSDAAGDASAVQAQASRESIAERRRQFDAVQALLKPYVDAGPNALTGQQNLIGLNGPEAQKAAYAGIEGSPAFQAFTQQGENAILQNASATGGLRGGNTQKALAQFRPELLAKLIESQYAKLGGITSLGQNAAAGVGNAGMNTAAGISGDLNQMGAAQAGGILGAAKAESQMWGNVAGAVGQFAGLGGFGKF